MPVLASPDLGQIHFLEKDVISFPEGVPAFEHLHTFLLVQPDEFAPFMFLVSTDSPATRFICLPICLIDPDYHFELDREEGARTGFEAGAYPVAAPGGPLVLAVTTIQETAPATVNLASPILVDAERRLGAQLILSGTAYSHVAPLKTRGRLEGAC